MGAAGQGKMTTHQQKKLDDDELIAFRNRFDLPLTDEQAQRAGASTSRPTTAPRCATCTQRRAALGGYLPRARDRRDRGAGAGARRATPRFALQAEGKEMSTTMAFVRMLGDAAQGPDAGPAHRADRRRRGAHLRHGQPVQAGRHLLAASASATSPRTSARCSATARRIDGQILEEGISEAGAIGQLDRGGHQLQRARPGDAAVLHLLLDVRLPARRRPDLGRGRPARARLPARRHRRAAPRSAARACSTRTAAATWWPRRSRTAAPTTRPSPASWPSSSTHGMRRDAGRAARRLLLRHGDERELRAAVAAGAASRTTSSAACTACASVRARQAVGAACGCSAPARSCAR